MISQIKEKIEDVSIVAVMSGNFVQRGEPAILDKWTRAKTALSAGVDLILEIPFVFACNNAVEFAYGGVGIIENIGCTDYIAFGIESENDKILYEIAKASVGESPELDSAVRFFMSEGSSYSSAYTNALAEITGIPKEEFAKSNNILAIEYLKQLMSLKSDVVPVTIKRKSAGYHETDDNECFAGASALRKMLDELKALANNSDFSISELLDEDRLQIKKYVPSLTFEALKNGQLFGWEDYFQILRYKILTTDLTELEEFYGVVEGIENRVSDMILKAHDFDEFLNSMMTRRYSESRIKRMMVSILMDFTKKDYDKIKNSGKFAAGVLGFNEKGRKILSKIKETSSDNIEIITNPEKNLKHDDMIGLIKKYDSRSQEILWSVSKKAIYDISDYRKKPEIWQE